MNVFKISTYFCMIMFFLLSCSKDVKVSAPNSFNVSVNDSITSYKAGEPVNFIFEGNAAIVSFYSGEYGHDFNYREGHEADVSGSNVEISFKSGIDAGTPIGTQVHEFKLLVSTDYDGSNEFDKVKAATWIDISDRVSKFGTNSNGSASGNIDVTDLFNSRKEVYFAFKYVNKEQATGPAPAGLARPYYVQNFTILGDAKSGGNPVEIKSHQLTGFRFVEKFKDSALSRSSQSDTRFTLYGPIFKDPNSDIYDPANPIYDPKNPIYDPSSPSFLTLDVPVFAPYNPNSPWNDPETEVWAISAPVSLKEKVDLGYDHSSPVTGSIYQGDSKSYEYTYNVAGTYEAVFVASNNSTKERKEVIRKITITITK